MTTSRNPWPWAIGIFIGCFALAMASFVVWSLRHRQDLVMEDYYEQDANHQERMAHIANARRQAGHTFRYDAATRSFIVTLPATASNALVALYRPSNAALDQELPLDATTLSSGRLSADGLHAGLWRAHLTWIQNGEGQRVEETFVVE